MNPSTNPLDTAYANLPNPSTNTQYANQPAIDGYNPYPVQANASGALNHQIPFTIPESTLAYAPETVGASVVTTTSNSSMEKLKATPVMLSNSVSDSFNMNDVAYAMPVQLHRYPSGDRFSPQYFHDYDKTVYEIEIRKNVPAHIDENRRSTLEKREKLNSTKSLLVKIKTAKPKLEKRIERNEHPRFFHYFQFHRHEKVAKLKESYNSLEEKEAIYIAKQKDLESKISQLEDEAKSLSSEQNSADSLEVKRAKMFADVVASAPPTVKLSNLIAAGNAKFQEIVRENTLRESVSNAMHQMQKSLDLYQESFHMLEQAESANTTAQILNFGDSNTAEFIETTQQMERNELVNQSGQPAMLAAQVMTEAIQSFPDEATRRYPSMCAQIGHAPLPKLKKLSMGGTFGAKLLFGDTGDFIHGMHASNKIEANMRILQDCMRIVAEQMHLVQVVYDEIGRGIDRANEEIANIKAQEARERIYIFQVVRSQYIA